MKKKRKSHYLGTTGVYIFLKINIYNLKIGFARALLSHEMKKQAKEEI